jgi:hypothetical protein
MACDWEGMYKDTSTFITEIMDNVTAFQTYCK